MRSVNWQLKKQNIKGTIFFQLLSLMACIGYGQKQENWQKVAHRSFNFYEIKAAFLRDNAAKLSAYKRDMDNVKEGRISQIQKVSIGTLNNL